MKIGITLCILYLLLSMPANCQTDDHFASHIFKASSYFSKIENSKDANNSSYHLSVNFKSINSQLNQEKITITGFPVSTNETADIQLTRKRSIIDANTKFLIGGSEKEPLQLPAINCYAGEISGEPGSKVFLFCCNNLFLCTIDHGDGLRFVISPDLKSEGNDTQYLMYNDKTFLNNQLSPFKCSFDETQENKLKEISKTGSYLGKSKFQYKTLSNNLLECELAVETDSEFFMNCGADLTKVQAYTLALFSLVSYYYELETNVCFYITWLKTWTDSPKDPYNCKGDGVDLANKAHDYWNNNYKDVKRDLAHIMTSIGYGGGGFGYYDALCSKNGDYGYAASSVQGGKNLPTYSFTYDVYIICHEIGHNFNAQHTHSCFWGAPLDTCMVDEGIQGKCLDSTQQPLPNPGSFMSYCGGVNSQYGFGWQVRMTFLPPVANYIRQTAESASCLTAPPQPKLSLLNPKGQETFMPNDPIELKWTSSQVDYINLSYSSDSGLGWNIIAENLSASPGTFNWNMPDVCSNKLLLRIYDPINPLTADTTKLPFSILKEDTTGLVASYPFTGNTNDEQFCHFYNLIVKNEPVFTKDRGDFKDAAINLQDSAYLYCPDFNYNFDEITVTWWFNAKDLSGKRNFIGSNWQEAAIFEIFFWGQFGASLYLDGNGTPTQFWAGNLPVNQWQHGAFTFDGTKAKLYLNGNKISEWSDGKSHKLNKSPRANLYVGSRGANDYSSGILDDIRIFRRELNDTEIQKIYNEIPTSVKNVSIENSEHHLCIYPNPVYDKLILHYTTTISSKVKISIYNDIGELIQTNEFLPESQGLQITELNVNSLRQGFYLCKLQCDNFILTGNFGIIR